MALGERFRSGGARGIARFLSDHQDCNAGFDVRREDSAGTGRLSITCKGCHQAITYKAAEAGEWPPGPAGQRRLIPAIHRAAGSACRGL
jgi:hypothetical protein